MSTRTENNEGIRAAATHEEIARRAYELWEQSGHDEGNDRNHWLEAERQLRGCAPGEVKNVPHAARHAGST